MESWSSETIQKVDSKLKGAKEKDLRFYRINEFKRNIERINKNTNCKDCLKYKSDINEVVETINLAIDSVGKERIKYDKLISKISKHIQKEHGFYPPYYFSYLFSSAGIAIGLIIGFVLSKTLPMDFVLSYSIGFVAGLFPGYVMGSIRDKKIRTSKKIM